MTRSANYLIKKLSADAGHACPTKTPEHDLKLPVPRNAIQSTHQERGSMCRHEFIENGQNEQRVTTAKKAWGMHTLQHALHYSVSNPILIQAVIITEHIPPDKVNTQGRDDK